MTDDVNDKTGNGEVELALSDSAMGELEALGLIESAEGEDHAERAAGLDPVEGRPSPGSATTERRCMKVISPLSACERIGVPSRSAGGDRGDRRYPT